MGARHCIQHGRRLKEKKDARRMGAQEFCLTQDPKIYPGLLAAILLSAPFVVWHDLAPLLKIAASSGNRYGFGGSFQIELIHFNRRIGFNQIRSIDGIPIRPDLILSSNQSRSFQSVQTDRWYRFVIDQKRFNLGRKIMIQEHKRVGASGNRNLLFKQIWGLRASQLCVDSVVAIGLARGGA